MDDFERYGDYDEIEDESQKNSSTVFSIIKIIAGLLIFAVIGVVAARIFTFNYYPSEMKRLYFTSELTDFYRASDGEFEVYTQSLRAPYDDANQGNFFCDYLIIVPEAGHLQICMRYNRSLADGLKQNYGFDGFDTENEEQFSFRLWRSGGESADGYEIGRLSAVEWDEFAMYRYCRLSFEDVDFGFDSEDGADWIRLEIFIDGVEKDGPFMVAIYENNDDYSKFSEYRLKKGEIPR